MVPISRPTTTVVAMPDDRILPITRLVSAIIVPFLVLAFLILYLHPDQSGQRFAWHIQPHLQAMYVAAGYLGGGYFFLRTIFERRWHHVAGGFLPVTTFTVSMLLLTILHWDLFDLRHFPFQVWLVLYIVTPVLVPWLWLHNRLTDRGIGEPGDVIVPVPVRWLMTTVGAGVLMVALLAFFVPGWLISWWSWALTPLSARAMGGWLALTAVGGLVLGRERRWSSWRIPLESIAIWHGLVLIAAALNPADFTGGSPVNWYSIAVVLVLVGVAALYVWMERRRWVEARRAVGSTPGIGRR